MSTTEMATSHISLTAMSIQTARSRPLAPLLSISDTLDSHPFGTAVML